MLLEIRLERKRLKRISLALVNDYFRNLGGHCNLPMHNAPYRNSDARPNFDQSILLIFIYKIPFLCVRMPQETSA